MVPTTQGLADLREGSVGLFPGQVHGHFAHHGELFGLLALAVTGSVPVDGIPPLDDLPMLAGQQRVVLRNAGVIDPTRLEHYLARDGYRGDDAYYERVRAVDAAKIF